jgi:F0F1-type ATP synthase membrane subunit b/b'
MNEKLIQQVINIEKQAQEIYEAAVRDAEQLPIQANQEVEALIEKARMDSEEEARALVAKAEAKEECARILAEAEEQINVTKGLALSHFERAVGYVVDRVSGRE